MSSQQEDAVEETSASTNQRTNDEHENSETLNNDATSSSFSDAKEAQEDESSVSLSSDSDIDEVALNRPNEQEIKSEDDSATDLIELSKLPQNPLDDQGQNK